MTRRELLALTCFWAAGRAAAAGQHVPASSGRTVAAQPIVGDADVTLRISEITWELAPGRTIKTLTYNDRIPGPLIRVPSASP